MNREAFSDAASTNKQDGTHFEQDSELEPEQTHLELPSEELLQAVFTGCQEKVSELLRGNKRAYSLQVHDKCIVEVSKQGSACLVNNLVQLGAVTEAKSEEGWTVMYIAVDVGNSHIFSILLQESADVNSANSESYNTLILSIRPLKPLLSSPILVLQQEGMDTECKDILECTEFIKSLQRRDITMIKALIHVLIDVDLMENPEGDKIYYFLVTCFGQAVINEAEKAKLFNMVEFLLKLKPGESPLLEAALRGDIDLMKSLIDSQGFCVCRDDYKHRSFLQYFFATKVARNSVIGDVDVPVVQLLLENGVDVNGNSWNTHDPPIITAVQAGSLALVKLLHKYKAKVDVVAKHSKKTPLELAVESGSADVFHFLLNLKCGLHVGSPIFNKDVSYKDSAIHLCLMTGHTNCANILLRHGAKVDVPRAIQFSVCRNEKTSLKFLLEKFPASVQGFLTEYWPKANRIFTEAISKDYVDIIYILLKAKVKIPPYLLGHVRSVAMVQLLVNNGVDYANWKLKNGNPLLLVYIQGCKEVTASVVNVVRILLYRGADVNERGPTGFTPFMAAAKIQSSSYLLNTLIQFGADVNVKDREGNTAFLYAVGGNCLENTKFLIELEGSQKVDIHVKNASGSTALMLAVSLESKSICALLLAHGASTNIEDKNGDTALILAVRNSAVDIVKQLLDNEANMNHQNKETFTALMVAAHKCSCEGSLLDTLLRHGADINIRDRRGNTALFFAAAGGCIATVQLFLDYGRRNTKFDIDAQNRVGSTALLFAVKFRRISNIDLLIAHGADTNIGDYHCRNTALTWAASTNYTDAVRKLIEGGADVNHQNRGGFTALMYASSDCDEDIMELLMDAGASTNMTSFGEQQGTAIHYLLKSKRHDQSTICKSLDLLVSRGASSSVLGPDVFYDAILSGRSNVVARLMASGFGPADSTLCKISRKFWNPFEQEDAPEVTPFIYALLTRRHKLARYINDIWFLCKRDVQFQGKCHSLRKLLEFRRHYYCLAILNEFCFQPMSLLKLSFVTVSCAIGCAPGREERVEKLPLPSIIKKMLHFRGCPSGWIVIDE